MSKSTRDKVHFAPHKSIIQSVVLFYHKDTIKKMPSNSDKYFNTK
jgi:hypothetical protein